MRGSAPGLTPSYSRLLSPARYLLVRQPAKRAFDFGWPVLLTVVTISAFILLPVTPRILGDTGLLKGLRDLIGLLVAFFVAALAAVSTVEREALDAPMLGMPPQLRGETLTRRRFLCLLFGYLAMSAFGLYLGAILAEVVAPSLRSSFSLGQLNATRFVLGTIYSLAFWNMVCTTMLGIWFLIERVPLDLAEQAPTDIVNNLVVKPRFVAEKEEHPGS